MVDGRSAVPRPAPPRPLSRALKGVVASGDADARNDTTLETESAMTGSEPVRAMIDPSPSDIVPRLLLTTADIGSAVLDGGWWPTSWNATIELPGLIGSLTESIGPIDRIVLNAGVWDSRFRRLGTGSDAVQMVWSDSLDPALLIAMIADRVVIHLLVVPPGSSPTVAARAMNTAAHHVNQASASDLLAAARNAR
jgi:uncharacterized protein DUF5994